MDGLTSQNLMPVDGEGIRGKALKKMVVSLFLKERRVEMMKKIAMIVSAHTLE